MHGLAPPIKIVCYIVIPRSEYLQSLRMIYGLIDMFEYLFNSEEFYGLIYEA